ncbi:hypothetical protein KIN20_024555 [Parelaphostrongylus tenuis]|uniref:Uncharacterized protein n=1 Tax=Parelaphostrongylus tenuis TaxID=148309 RepID=A0AAD5NCW3_PARTN|nr:hypothetical protein KIN20_024555 [Parelaphostrongylus tenuis]
MNIAPKVLCRHLRSPFLIKVLTVDKNCAKDRQVVGRTATYEWFIEFGNGDTDLVDQLGSKRPREIDREAIIDVIEEDSTLSTSDLADALQCFRRGGPIDFERLKKLLPKFSGAKIQSYLRSKQNNDAFKVFHLLPK